MQTPLRTIIWGLLRVQRMRNNHNKRRNAMKSVFTKAINLISEFFINFRKKTMELGISEEEFQTLLES
jgi:hypothetical protein